MVSYECNRCGKLFNQKVDYMRHINRKIPCKSNKIDNTNEDTHKIQKDTHKIQKDTQLMINQKDTQ